jgi:large subunit ribosomal protein L23
MIVLYPLSTEKTIRMMESENTLIFIVDKKSSKEEIRKEIESLYKVKVAKVRTTIDAKVRKKAYVKFSAETPAIDLATQLGLM